MEIVPSTILALAGILVLTALGPRRGLWAFFALTPFGAAAAFNLPALGGATIGLKELAVVAVVALVLMLPRGPDRVLGTLRPGQPGFVLLLLLFWCGVSAAFLPRVFAGATEVFSISREANARGIVSRPLHPTTGNVTQLFYLTLAGCAFAGFATVFRGAPDHGAVVKALAVATGVNFALGWIDVGAAAAGLSSLLDPIRTANYAILADHRMAGMKRMIGGFPEASAMGTYALALFAFWLRYLVGNPYSGLARAMLLMAGIVLLRSTSSGAYVALAVFLLLFAGIRTVLWLRPAVSREAVVMALTGGLMAWAAALALFAAYEMADPVTAFFDRALFDKLESASGVERMSWNAQAFRNFTDTWLLGAGLGSVRASNWLLASLGSIGLPGTLLFVAFLVTVARLPAGREETGAAVVSGLKAACAALLVSALLTAATPNLGVFFFTLAGLAAGLSRGRSLAA